MCNHIHSVRTRSSNGKTPAPLGRNRGPGLALGFHTIDYSTTFTSQSPILECLFSFRLCLVCFVVFEF